MQWVAIFLFATMGDIYVLTDPSFDTKKECMDFLIEERPAVQQKLIMEYGYMRKIELINCMRHDEFLDIIQRQDRA